MICEIKEAVTGSDISQKTKNETIALVEQLGISKKMNHIIFCFEIIKICGAIVQVSKQNDIKRNKCMSTKHKKKSKKK